MVAHISGQLGWLECEFESKTVSDEYIVKANSSTIHNSDPMIKTD